jgi:hypothetical protein
MNIPREFFVANTPRLTSFHPHILVTHESACEIVEKITYNIEKYKHHPYQLRKLIYRFAFKEYDENKDKTSKSSTKIIYHMVSTEYNNFRKRHQIDKNNFFSSEQIKFRLFGYFLGIHSLSKFEKKMVFDTIFELHCDLIDEMMIDDLTHRHGETQFQIVDVILRKSKVNFQIHQKNKFQHFTKKLDTVDEDKYLDQLETKVRKFKYLDLFKFL